MLRRLLTAALLAGALSGLLATAIQALWATPLIVEAESYERAGSAAPDTVSRGSEHRLAPHHAAGWAPSGGLERTTWSAAANVGLGIGLALLLAAALILRGETSLAGGLALGAVGFLSFNVAPALGLPPELPGTAAAALEPRQVWWVMCVLATATGLSLALLVPRASWKLRLVGLMVASLPYLVGAPHPEAYGTLAPARLQSEFVAAVLFTAAVFWLALALSTTWLFRRLQVQPRRSPTAPGATPTRAPARSR